MKSSIPDVLNFPIPNIGDFNIMKSPIPDILFLIVNFNIVKCPTPAILFVIVNFDIMKSPNILKSPILTIPDIQNFDGWPLTSDTEEVCGAEAKLFPPVEEENSKAKIKKGKKNKDGKDRMHFRGIQKRPWRRYAAGIRDPGKKRRVWLGAFETAAARAYATAAREFWGAKAKLNLPPVEEKIKNPEMKKNENCNQSPSPSPKRSLILIQDCDQCAGMLPDLNTIETEMENQVVDHLHEPNEHQSDSFDECLIAGILESPNVHDACIGNYLDMDFPFSSVLEEREEARDQQTDQSTLPAPHLERHGCGSSYGIEVPTCSDPASTQPMSTISHPMPPMMPPLAPSQDTSPVTVKAMYGDDIIKFKLPPTSGIIELKEEVAMRLKLKLSSFKLKYKDEDGDWILLTCDKDLGDYLQLFSSMVKPVIRLLVDKVAKRRNRVGLRNERL
ncbi:hypothetical protein RHGRI_013050 [Rhododendron griersonianum]|uniref:AP2/ERF domain-containing protein n=1 Tax=Rhododendron griersonianum TaxID=479676 RepID=A0AAV6K4H5_9ERIC|nr:hypothetical protein RHGRI_013050 [Rhododendron griersonianum]